MSTIADPRTSTFPITLTDPSSSLGPSIKIPRTSHSPGLSLESQSHTPITSGSDSDVESNYMGSRKRLRVHDGCFVEPHDISSRISHIFKERLHQDGYGWKAVPQEVRDLYWGEFQSWQHSWNDASVQSIRERQSRNFHSDTGRSGSRMSRHNYGSISLAKHARQIEMNDGAPLNKDKILGLSAMECQDKFGNQVLLSKEDKGPIFLQIVEASSHSIYMHGAGRNKSSSYASDASTSIGPLELAYRRIKELELVQSQLQEEARELRSNIQSFNEWKLQTEKMMRCMMEQMMEERERFRVGQLPPDGPDIDQTQSPPNV